MSQEPAPEETAMPADKEDNWGYDLYPERRGKAPVPEWWKIAFFGEGRTNIDKTNCERSVYKCFETSMLLVIYLLYLFIYCCLPILSFSISCALHILQVH